MPKKIDIFFHTLILFVLFLVLLSLDHITKEKVKTLLSENMLQYKKVTSFFNIVICYNFGIAFGIFNEHYSYSSHLQQALIISLNCTAIFILFMIIRKDIQKNISMLYLVFIPVFSGAIGNIADRLVHGYVFDFIDIHWNDKIHFPAFNFADIFISFGAIAYLVIEIIKVIRDTRKIHVKNDLNSNTL